MIARLFPLSVPRLWLMVLSLTVFCLTVFCLTLFSLNMAGAFAAEEPAAGNGDSRNPYVAFRYLDADYDGRVTKEEFEQLKQVPVFRTNPLALPLFFSRLDADRDGELTLEEYLKVDELRGGANPPHGLLGRLRAATQPKAPATQTPSPKTPAAKTPAATTPAVNRAAAERPTTAAIAHFEKSIRPVLVAQCYGCHSADAKEIKGGLALDTREGIRRGGDTGPAVVPGDLENSLLIVAIRHEDGLEMPPKSRLSETQIADFVKWIEMGAADPRDGDATAKPTNIDIEQGREFWAFQPPKRTDLPQVQKADWPATEIDRFILAAQEAKGLQVAADAEPRVLVRRLYFDLIGLPPTTGQVNAFVEGWQTDSQGTLERTVDELLASPKFGERWGRHWLDVARFAESSGKETSFSYPQAWRYRDYVIDAFNADLPFDQFIREQIAGDLLPTDTPADQARQTIATGFLAIGPKSHIERNRLQFEMDLVDEQIDTVTQAFLGMTVACARCHDHKFDPIPQSDYYALAGIFRSTETRYGTIPVIQNNNPSRLIALPLDAGLPAGVRAIDREERERLVAQIEELRAQQRQLRGQGAAGVQNIVRINIQLSTLEGRLNSYHVDGSPKLQAMGARDRDSAVESPLYVRGEIDKPADRVPRGFVQVLCNEHTPGLGSGSGRLELADWIASADNPLTGRVIANRVWLKLFGRGIVTTPDNFGASGQLPSHPELLDHLAIGFMQEGWSVKKLIRSIVLSRVYRLDSEHDDANFAVDPDNVFLWRMSPRRLDAEAIRDSMLFLAGVLDPRPQVGSAVAISGEGLTGFLERGNQLAEDRFDCRAVYLPVIRGRAFESLDVFDGVDGSLVTGQRDQTTVPSQSLYLLNSPYVMGLASDAAVRLMRAESDPRERVSLAYAAYFGRPATETEQHQALEFLERYREQVPSRSGFFRRPESSELAAWATFCQSLWASAEFLVRK